MFLIISSWPGILQVERNLSLGDMPYWPKSAIKLKNWKKKNKTRGTASHTRVWKFHPSLWHVEAKFQEIIILYCPTITFPNLLTFNFSNHEGVKLCPSHYQIPWPPSEDEALERGWRSCHPRFIATTGVEKTTGFFFASGSKIGSELIWN